MKAILFLEQQSWIGGAQRVLEAILESLPPEEFNSIVAFPGQGPFREALAAREIETITSPIGDYRSGRKSCLETVIFAFRSVLCGLKLAAVIQRRHVALVYINGPRCLLAGVLAAWLTGRPSMFHLHLILTRKPELLLAARLARYCSKIIVCSQAAAASLLDADCRLSEKTQILYNPVPELAGEACRIIGRARQDSLAPTPSFTVGMVGRITESKGQHLLLDAVGNLPLQIRDRIRILIVGAPAPACPADLHYANDLRTRALQYGLQDRVTWTGYRTDPGPCYASMDVLVHAALTEAMCLVILEALQNGVPVIATRVGGIPEIVDEGSNGLLVAPGDEDALGQALTLFLVDGSLRERLRSGARSGLDDRFSLKSFSPKIRTMVGQLCNPTASREAKVSDQKPPAWN